MGRNQCKKDENTQNQNASPPSWDHNSSPAREQGWMENESDALTETGFTRPYWFKRGMCRTVNLLLPLFFAEIIAIHEYALKILAICLHTLM
ncbi:LINE-1 retrotransposable element ORF1 protein [Plecturocebus cupreus]